MRDDVKRQTDEEKLRKLTIRFPHSSVISPVLHSMWAKYNLHRQMSSVINYDNYPRRRLAVCFPHDFSKTDHQTWHTNVPRCVLETRLFWVTACVFTLVWVLVSSSLYMPSVTAANDWKFGMYAFASVRY